MPQRALVVEDSAPVARALRQHLEWGGFRVDLARSGEALGALRPGHAFAVVRASEGELIGRLKDADPLLPVVAVLLDDDQAEAEGASVTADGLLVGPLTRPVVVSTCRAMARLRGQALRLAEMENGAPRPPAADGRFDFDFFKKLLLMEVRRSHRYHYPISLAMAGVDRWRDLASSRSAGQRAALLGEVLAVIAGGVRDIDLPLLYAEERFLVLMPHTRAPGALQVAERLCSRVRSRKELPPVTLSAGVAAFDGEGPVSFSSLVKDATQALERARAAGGDRSECAPLPSERPGRADAR